MSGGNRATTALLADLGYSSAMTVPRLVLASASPRRLSLLRALGLDPPCRPSGLPEPSGVPGPPHELVATLAAAKGRRVGERLLTEQGHALVLAADTAVVLEREVFGKPADPEDAVRMLRRLSGKNHDVHTAVFLLHTETADEASLVASTKVRFRRYGERTIRWYVESGEPLDKAGAYGIQGRGALLVESLEGSWSNVVGLPLERLPELFDRVGVDLFELISSATPRNP